MKIFIQMGYVTHRRGAKLHVDIDGVASCKSGAHRIIAEGQLDASSATKICRRCERALHTLMVWRRDDLSRKSLGNPNRRSELAELDNLLDALDSCTSPQQRDAEQKMLDDIRANLVNLAQQTNPKPFTMSAPQVSDDQTSLF